MVAAPTTRFLHQGAVSLASRERLRRAGFSLIEVMVATVLLIVALVGSIALSVGLLRGNQFNRERDTAYFLAQQQLDLFAVEPMSQILLNPLTYPNTGVASTSSNAACYSIGQDAYIDNPISCVVNTPAAYFLRTWICCNPGGPLPLGGIPVAGCNNAAGAVPITSPDAVNGGAVCLVQVEVTWPSEPAGVLATAPWGGGFAENVFTTVPPLTFTNHVYLSMVREQ
jgi:type II secretory pathway pseudopilin PulG